MLDDFGEILQNQRPRVIWVEIMELGHVMALAATNIDKQRRIKVRSETVDELFLDGKEVGAAPWRSSLPITAHMIVELRTVTLLLLP